jgi:hypothetical protein
MSKAKCGQHKSDSPYKGLFIYFYPLHTFLEIKVLRKKPKGFSNNAYMYNKPLKVVFKTCEKPLKVF